MSKMTLSEARAIAGSLSFPSKMPSTAYDLPAKACILGAKLANLPGTVCGSCYALKGHGFYLLGNAVKGQARRLAAISGPLWVEAMVMLLGHAHAKPYRVDLGEVGVRLQRQGGSRFRWSEPGFHRWHSSGDLQSVNHLARICEVARRTPQIKHWLPTNELGFVKSYLMSGGTVPDNLLIRISSIMLDDTVRRSWPTTSSVFNTVTPTDAHICPAPTQNHRCMDCRACWSREVTHIAYEMH